MDQKTENSIIRYLSNEATSEDLDLLTRWISVDDNVPVFEYRVALYYQTIAAVNDPDVDKITRVLLEQIRKDRKTSLRRKIKPFFKYAALGLLFFALGYFFEQEIFGGKESYSLISEQEKVTIVLDDGTIETVEPDHGGELVDAKGNVIGHREKSKLTYTRASASGKPAYHTIKVPYGKKFDLVLSDGTHVSLNSGTSLRYPVKFLKDSVRMVSLSGEAYFEVTEDKEHPFVVDANEVQVEVLGTKFNISHYPEDTSINTVLVSGAVFLKVNGTAGRKHGPVLLEPGYKGEWIEGGDKIHIEKVNTDIYTSWVEGRLVFSNTSFLKIRQALERRYNVEIINNNTALDEQRYDATFDVETIEQILESFKKSYAIEYEIRDNKIVIN